MSKGNAPTRVPRMIPTGRTDHGDMFHIRKRKGPHPKSLCGILLSWSGWHPRGALNPKRKHPRRKPPQFICLKCKDAYRKVWA